MPKNITQNSVVDTTVNKVTVNSAPQGAGQTFAYTLSSTTATIFNTSAAGSVEYQLNAGPWVLIPRGTGPTINCDLAVDTIKLRQVNVSDGVTTVEISVESAPSSNYGGIVAPLVIINLTGTAPANADGRPIGTLYFY